MKILEKNFFGVKREKRSSGLALTMKLNIAVLLVLSALIAWSIFLVREKLLKNSDEMGTHLAESYAMEEENRISIYRMLMHLGAVYADENIETYASEESLQQWLAGYSMHLSEVLGADIIDPYAVIDGKIIAAVPWQGDDSYDYANTEWYQKALEADGDIIFTNAYEDAITGKQLVTIAKKLKGEGNVLAFDILMEKFHSHKNKVSIPEKSSYFLFDGNGKLIYLASDLEYENEATIEYAQELLNKIRQGELDSYTATITDLDHANRSVYYYEMDNGWCSVITMPVEKILIDGWNSVILTLVVISLALYLAIAAVLIRGYLDARKVKHVQDTLQILGDTYYAIYRINCETERYEVIKSQKDVKEQLGDVGEYQYLLKVMGRVVDRDTYEKFCSSFSIENIRKLVADKTGEFGGDYQRKFEDGFHWVNVQLIYKEALGLNEVILCFRDIDLEKRRQIQQHMLLENALESARQTAQAKSMFFSNVSHDMRTPLNAIIGLADLAGKNRGDAGKVAEYIEKIGQAGKQLLTLINDILDMSRIEHGNQSLMDYSEMDIVQCIEETVSMFTVPAEQENKHLLLKTDVEHRKVYCDAYRLNQIMNNLLSNAFKYSPEGAEVRVVVKEAASQGNHSKYQISVSDTGYGMSEEFLKRIFEPFTRETVLAPKRISGTGLGMPIVKSFVQQMNGEITVQSRQGEGSTFIVTIPLQILPEKEGGRTDAAVIIQEEPTEERKAEAVRPLEGKRILVAEDNEINMEITEDLLTMQGAEVLKAWNGKEAVAVFEKSPEGSIDAILMDMHMPEMDGCSAAKTIRGMERQDASRIPMIAVTANAFAEDIARTTQAGMNGHVSKPVDFDRLLKLLSDLL